MKPQTVNNLTAAAAIVVFVAVAVFLAALSSRPHRDALLQRPSTFFTDASGTRALFLISAKLLPAAEQWRRPLDLLPIAHDANSPATLIVAGPGRALGASEARHLDRWLSAGGQLILLADDGWRVRERAAAGNRDATSRGQAEGPAEQTFLSRYASLNWTEAMNETTGFASGASLPAERLMLSWRRGFSRADGARVIAAAGPTALAVEIPVGRGRIVAIADPTIATNGALRRSDNAVWLVSIAAGWGSGRVLFDEYHHGFGQKRSTAEMTAAFLATPWGWAVLQLGAAGLLYVFGYHRRFGRIRETPPLMRSSPMEAIDARAGLLHAAGARQFAAELIVQHLVHATGRGREKKLESSNSDRALGAIGKNAPAGELDALCTQVTNGAPLRDRELVEIGRRATAIFRGDRA